MKIKIRFAELHTPLFLAGTNLTAKLDTVNNNRREIFLQYDTEMAKLHVVFNEHLCLIPDGNIASMTVDDPTALLYAFGPTKKPEVKLSATPPKGKVKAQVSHPVEDLVYGGPKG